MRFLASSIGSLFLCIFSSAAQAGAWLFPEGRGQAILTTTFADARKAYDANGRLIQTPPYRKFETRLYVEHGVREWLTFVGESGFMNFHGAANPTDHLSQLIAEANAGLPLSVNGPDGPHYEGLGLGFVAARLRLFSSDNSIVSFQAGLRAASPAVRRFLDMREATQVDARLMIGRAFTFFGFKGFTDTQIGFRSAGQNGDELRMDWTLGLRPIARLLLMAQRYSAFAPRGGIATILAAQRFQLSGVYDVTPAVSFQLGGVTAIAGTNSPVERGVISALWWHY